MILADGILYSFIFGHSSLLRIVFVVVNVCVSALITWSTGTLLMPCHISYPQILSGWVSPSSLYIDVDETSFIIYDIRE